MGTYCRCYPTETGRREVGCREGGGGIGAGVGLGWARGGRPGAGPWANATPAVGEGLECWQGGSGSDAAPRSATPLLEN